MRDSVASPSYRVVIVTLDHHAAGPAARVTERLSADWPGLSVEVHAAAEWAETPAALDRAKAAVARGDIIIANLLFIEEHVRAILPDLQARRDHCDAMIGVIADKEVVQLTRMGDLDMMKPASGAMAFLKKLRGKREPTADSGEKQMRMLRRLPKILKYIPGKAQDLRAWFLTMQYWLGGSDDNVEAMVRFLADRYADRTRLQPANAKAAKVKPAAPVEYPDVGLYHPRLAGRITTDLSELPSPKNPVGTVGVLMLRSYILASDCAHYDAVIEALEAKGLRVIAGFAGGLDGRPVIDRYLREANTDLVLSLTGFSLVGGPAYNDSLAAVETLSGIDVPYICAQPLEFQTISQWSESDQGLGPIEATMLVALPEIDGASNPIVFAGRHAEMEGADRAMAPCPERIERLASRCLKLATLHASKPKDRKVGIVLFGFPPNAGAVGTAAYLSVFESLHNTLLRMKAEGYDLNPPETVDELREVILKGNAEQFGVDANVLTQVPTDDIVRRTPWLSEIEAQWGPAPGRVQANGKGVFVLGAQFGNVAVTVQPGFGYEGDPMRLLFEKGFA
ncbi:MAG: cobaltochelatase subunit CobN, partial [Pseudomonadota bacterium]